MGDDWTDDIEEILSKVRQNCIDMYKYHLYRYFQYKRVLPIFRVPVLILNALNSVFSVGLQPYMEQGLISVLNCMISLVATLINSIEMYMGIQKSMESEMSSSQGFYILSIGIYKMLTLTRENRDISGKQYLIECYNTYSELVRNSKLIKDPNMLKNDFLQSVESAISEKKLGTGVVLNNLLENGELEKPTYSNPYSYSLFQNTNFNVERGEGRDLEGGFSFSEKAIDRYLLEKDSIKNKNPQNREEDLYSFSRHHLFGPSRKNSFLEIAGAINEETKDEIPSLDIPNQIVGTGINNIRNIFQNSSTHSQNSNPFSNHSNHLFAPLPRNAGTIELNLDLSTLKKEVSNIPENPEHDSNPDRDPK